MVFWRTGNHVYFHGSAKNRMFNALANVRQCCFVATRIDAFVLARAALHHSVNYRSVVIYGEAQEVCEPELKLDALKTLIGKFYPGRWERIRAPSPGEFAAVRVFRLPIEEVFGEDSKWLSHAIRGRFWDSCIGQALCLWSSDWVSRDEIQTAARTKLLRT